MIKICSFNLYPIRRKFPENLGLHNLPDQRVAISIELLNFHVKHFTTPKFIDNYQLPI